MFMLPQLFISTQSGFACYFPSLLCWEEASRLTHYNVSTCYNHFEKIYITQVISETYRKTYIFFKLLGKTYFVADHAFGEDSDAL